MLREKIKNWKMELAAVLVFVLVLGMTGLSGSVKAALAVRVARAMARISGRFMAVAPGIRYVGPFSVRETRLENEARQ